jgi:hypothetical protein
MTRLAIIDSYAARLLMMCLFLPERLQVIVVIAISAWFVYRTIATKQLPPTRIYLWALVLGVFYLQHILSVPLTDATHKYELMKVCERKLSLLLMPVIFAFITPAFGAVIRRELIYFVYACFISCALANADYLYHYFFVNGGLHHLSHEEYRDIFENFTGIHPTYMGFYLAFSICILLLAKVATKRERVLKYIAIYVLLFLFLTLLAKSPIIGLALVGIHYAYLQRRELPKFKGMFAGLIAMIAGVYIFVPFVRQRVGEIFSYFGIGKAGSTVDNSVYIRKLIWDVDTGLIRRYWLTGVGPGRMLSLLHYRYFFYSISNRFFVGYYDPHNEYFAAWLSFGILGIIVMLVVLIIHTVRAVKAKDLLYMYLLILFFVTFMTETMLNRQQGVLFYAIFTSLFFFLNLYAPYQSRNGSQQQ